MATPPCQGMSTAGVQDKNDERNKLILSVIKIAKELKPKYIFIENVPQFLSTEIEYKGTHELIPEIIRKELGKDYKINEYVIDTRNYSVPQMRQRAILLLSSLKENNIWELPQPDKKILTMKDAIGMLPKLDPLITDIDEQELLNIFPHF